MLVNALQIEANSEFHTTVCIVGGGVAGITLGLELDRLGIPSCLLEGGGVRLTRRSQSLYRGEVADGRYDLTATRARFLGGSSNCWGGWTRPFEKADFGGRSWLRDLGWPIGQETLDAHYRTASEYLQIDPPEDDAWTRELLRAELDANMDLDEDLIRSIYFRLSPPTKFGRQYREKLFASPHLRLLLNATAVEVLTTDTGDAARGVLVRSDRNSFKVHARIVVLAAGGVENARLLLASRKVHKAGIGNANDLVGRYFMDHPRLRVARVRMNDPERFSRLYDVRHYSGGALLQKRSRIAAALSPSLSEQARAGVLQSYTGLLACYAGQSDATVRDAAQIYKALTGHISQKIDGAMLGRAVKSIPAAAAYFLARKLGIRGREMMFELETVLEPYPDRDNRVELVAETDRFGVPKVRVTWRRSDLERRTHRHAIELVRRSFAERGIGAVEVDDAVWDSGWDDTVMTTWHHMGTTRMAAHRRAGVVNPDGQVFGVNNLFVAGSSVFPTGGGSPPTLTIVALALRLSEHVGRAVMAPEAAAHFGNREIA